MSIKVIYSKHAMKNEKALSVLLDTLTKKLNPAVSALTASEILPLVMATIDLAELAGKLDEAIFVLGQRIVTYETTVASEAPKPASGYAIKLDQRLTATSDLLRATLDRLDQLETAVTRLYKPPFLEIDANDKPRKKLASLRVGFDVLCGPT